MELTIGQKILSKSFGYLWSFYDFPLSYLGKIILNCFFLISDLFIIIYVLDI